MYENRHLFKTVFEEVGLDVLLNLVMFAASV